MTVLEYATKSNMKKFYCVSDIDICITYQSYYKRKGKLIPKKHTETTVHGAINQCILECWKEYTSYKRFANREFVERIDNVVYCHWTVRDLIREFIKLHGGKDYCKIISIDWIRNNLE